MFARFVVFASIAWPALALAQKAPPANPFFRYERCSLVPNRYNDGDSFHVKTPDGKEHIFRLYFVDAPEAETNYAERSADQAAYFGVNAGRTLEIAKEARDFTGNVLARSFTVQTRWRDALGRSALPRYYATITTANGQDLAELLVSKGLARIYGTRTPLPDGRTSRVYLARLTEVEARAKLFRVGGWKRQ